MDQSFWHLIAQTDIISKFILMIFLCMSIACWAITFYKLMMIRSRLAQLKKAQAIVDTTATLEELITKISIWRDNFAGEIIAHYLTDFKKILKNQKNLHSEKDLRLLQDNMAQTVDDVLAKEETLLPFLSTSAQVAPLLGLFGTVYGLIHAFMGISQSRSADISAVAPGIAEALITTMAGLVIAIPALVMYSYLQGRIRVVEHNLIGLSDKCFWLMRNLILKDELHGDILSSSTGQTIKRGEL